jgi:peptidoglycan/LPS O-acetylase OafA/YrhL
MAFSVQIFFVMSGMSLSIGFITGHQRSTLLKIAAGRYFRLTGPILIACLMIWCLAHVGFIFDETR